jgi:hypothetical protein
MTPRIAMNAICRNFIIRLRPLVMYQTQQADISVEDFGDFPEHLAHRQK